MMKAVWKRLGVGVLSGVTLACPLAAQETGGKYYPESKSTFSLSGKRQNPFWPIGYTPRETAVRSEPVKAEVVDIPQEAFNISSILLASPPLVVINEGEYTTGDEIPLSINGQDIRVRLIQIGDGFVKVRHRDKVFVIRKF